MANTEARVGRDDRPNEGRGIGWGMMLLLGLPTLIALSCLVWYFLGASAKTAPCTMTEQTDVVRDAHGHWHWKTIGGKPLTEHDVKTALAETRCFLESEHSLSPETIDALVAKVEAHPEGDSQPIVGNHEHYDAVDEEGPRFVRNVVTDFHKTAASKRTVARWQVFDKDGTAVTLDNFERSCTNHGLKIVPPHKPRHYVPRPKQHVYNVPPPKQVQTCFKIPLGEYDKVGGLQSPARVTMHVWAGPATWSALINNPCSQVYDGHSLRPLKQYVWGNMCCADCGQGGNIMADYPDEVVNDEQHRDHFGTACYTVYGRGFVLLPFDAALAGWPMQFCARTEKPYHGPGGEKRKDCFDNVSWREIRAAINRGLTELPRTVSAKTCPGRSPDET